MFAALMNFALNPIFQIRRRTGPVIAAALLGLAVNGGGVALLFEPYGAAGIAAAQTLGLAAAAAWLAYRALTGPERMPVPWRDLALSCAGCLAMMVLLAPLRHLEPALALSLCVVLGAGFYAALVWVFDVAGLRAAVLERVRARAAMPVE